MNYFTRIQEPIFLTYYFVVNKAKGRISKWVFRENKARQIFWKTNISYPLIPIRKCAYQAVRNVRFSENLACLVFLKHPFWDSPFCLISDELCRFEHFQNFLKSSLSTLALKYARNRKLSYLVEYRILFIWGLFRKNWWSNWISHTCVIFVWIYIYLYSKYLQ